MNEIIPELKIYLIINIDKRPELTGKWIRCHSVKGILVRVLVCNLGDNCGYYTVTTWKCWDSSVGIESVRFEKISAGVSLTTRRAREARVF